MNGKPLSPHSDILSDEATASHPKTFVAACSAFPGEEGPPLWVPPADAEGGAASDDLAAPPLAPWGLSRHQSLFRTFSESPLVIRQAGALV